METQNGISAILPLQLTIFTLIAVGFLFRKLKLVGPEGQRNLTDLVLYLFLPCNILTAFQTGADRDRLVSYVSIFLIACAVQLVSHFYGRLMYRRAPEGRRKCLQYASIVSNAGFIGNPLAEGLYGMEGLAMASVYLIPLRIVMWSGGVSLFAGGGDRKSAIRRILTHPCIISCALGIVLMLTGVKLPAAVLAPVQALARCNTAGSMMVVGMILSRIELRSFRDGSVYLFSLHRLILMPALFWLLLRFLPVDPLVFKISVLLTAMPAGATTSILAEKYGADSEYATKLVVISTLLSIPTVFLWTLLLG